MPFKSEKQRRYLYANQPKLAKKWSNMYGDKIVGLGGVSNKKKRATFKKAFGYEYDAEINERGQKIRQHPLPLDIAYQVANYRLKKQGYKDREDESLGMRRGAEKGKKQSYKDRRNESYGKFGKRDKEKKGKNKINKISGLGGLTTDEYLMRIAATLLSKGLTPSKFTKSKSKALLKDVKAKKKIYELIDKYPADITIYMKRIKNL
jgi:hypothetical protein